MNIINKMVWTIQRSQPGGWNDLDMLEVGNVSLYEAVRRCMTVLTNLLRAA
jgi:hypothetical protein